MSDVRVYDQSGNLIHSDDDTTTLGAAMSDTRVDRHVSYCSLLFTARLITRARIR